MQPPAQILPSFVGIRRKPIFVIRTGIPGTIAYFTPSLFQIRLEAENEQTTVHDIGYSGTLLLDYLISSRGNALSRDELTAQAWPDRVVGQGSLNQQIYMLRQQLGDDKSRSIIQTLPRRGYLFDPVALIGINYIEEPIISDSTGASETGPTLPNVAAITSVVPQQVMAPDIHISSPSAFPEVFSASAGSSQASIWTSRLLLLFSGILLGMSLNFWPALSPSAKGERVNYQYSITTPNGAEVMITSYQNIEQDTFRREILEVFNEEVSQASGRYSYDLTFSGQHMIISCLRQGLPVQRIVMKDEEFLANNQVVGGVLCNE